MPDISMCQNKTCPQRYQCYRFTAKPNPEYQSYSTFCIGTTGYCISFISNSDRK